MVDANDRKISGSANEAKALSKADLERRYRSASILNPSELRGEYDANRMLLTTLGGVNRVMTHDDLAVFRRNAQIAGKNFKGGITARQVIDLSLTIDRKRAREEIMWAMPSYGQQNPKGNLLVRFITDASQRNGASRHHVTIEFNGYQTALSSGAHAANRAARIMAKDQIKFDCDCGRHTFWYRYITTVGNFNSGRAETGYPKIRNPNLQGVACKHVLRVMAEIEGNGNILSFLTKAIEKARKQVGNKTKVQTSQKDADQQILKQNSRSTTKLDSREERNLHRSRIALRKSTKVARKAMPKPQIMASASRKMSHLGKMENNKNSEAILLQTIKGLGITPEQAMAIMKTMKT